MTYEHDPRKSPEAAGDGSLPEGAASDATALPATEPDPSTRRKFLSGLSLGLTIVAVFAAILLAVVSREPVDGEMRTLAVLPFASTGVDSSDAFFGGGFGDDLIARLGGTDPLRLRVTAPASARRFASEGHAPGDAPRVLGARFVLRGSVERTGDRVRVEAWLVRARDQSPLWHEAFERDLAGVHELQREIAAGVAKALAVNPAAAPREPDVTPAAYDATLRGREAARGGTAAAFQRAGASFRTALMADSTYAPAWAGLAAVYSRVGLEGLLPPAEVFPLARKAAQRASGIDSTHADAWTSLALLQGVFDRDIAAAERSLRRAIALNPSHGDAHQVQALLLAAAGRTDESFRAIERAIELDPLSQAVLADRGWLLFLARRHHDAALQLMTALQFDPAARTVHERLAWVNAARGDTAGAIHHAAEARALAGGAGASPYAIALGHAAAGRADSALTWLERSIERRDPGVILLQVDPRLDAVRGLPGFDALVRRVGLPEPAGAEPQRTGSR